MTNEAAAAAKIMTGFGEGFRHDKKTSSLVRPQHTCYLLCCFAAVPFVECNDKKLLTRRDRFGYKKGDIDNVPPCLADNMLPL